MGPWYHLLYNMSCRTSVFSVCRGVVQTIGLHWATWVMANQSNNAPRSRQKNGIRIYHLSKRQHLHRLVVVLEKKPVPCHPLRVPIIFAEGDPGRPRERWENAPWYKRLSVFYDLAGGRRRAGQRCPDAFGPDRRRSFFSSHCGRRPPWCRWG